MRGDVLNKEAGRGSSWRALDAGNSGRAFGLFRNLARGVK